MNIFVLDKDPVIAASYLCDKHVVKMAVETAQILSAALRMLGVKDDRLYKITHVNNPCHIWASKSVGNFDWLVAHGFAICEEYTRRYKKTHKSEAIIALCQRYRKHLPAGKLTEFVLVMPDKYKSSDVVESYREFYRKEKAPFAKWNYSNKPDWF